MMEKLRVTQDLIKSQVGRSTTTAYYAIRLINDSKDSISSLSIRESLYRSFDTSQSQSSQHNDYNPYHRMGDIKAKVSTDCKYIIPITDAIFTLTQDGEILNSNVSKLLPNESCIIYVTLEFPRSSYNGILCATISGKIKNRCNDKCHKRECYKCQYKLHTVSTCSKAVKYHEETLFSGS